MVDKQKNDEVVLSVDHVSKNFALPHEKNTSIKSGIVNIFRSKDKSVEVQHALKDISFEIKKGEFFGILGRNGSGKSTLLKLLAEIYQPTSGKVETKGKLVPFIELGVGFNPELTGRENVYLNGALLGFSRKEIDARYKDIVEFAELEEFMDQKLKNYSSGMQVRLAFSVATRAEADILLVDEVLAVGDADFQRKCFTFFKSLKQQKTTVIFVTHDMSAVREYCDRAILINEGNIAHEGTALEISNEYLKLFNKTTSSDDKNADGRWGNGTVVSKAVSAEVREKQNDIKIAISVEAKKDVEGVVAGIRIKNSAGLVVTGANSENAGRIALKAGQSTEAYFMLPNIFGNDIFNVDATLRLGDGVSICDNWDDAASFSVLKNTKAPYSIIPDIEVKLGKA